MGQLYPRRDVGDGWAMSSQVLPDQLTLSELEGADCAPPLTLLLAHPDLERFLRHCLATA